MNNHQTAFKRKLTGEESIFFRAPEANVSLVAQIKGTVDESKLRMALSSAAKIHPLLRAYCNADENYDVWFIINETQELPLEVVPRNSDDQWRAVIQKEYLIPFDFEQGPLIRFLLLKSNDVSDLLIYC